MIRAMVSELTTAVVAALREQAPALMGEELALLALDLHPWHGQIALCLLTEAECLGDPDLRDPVEMAGWRFFEFSERLEAWRAVHPLAQAMKADYEASRESAEKYFEVGAQVLGSPQVATELAKYRLGRQFRLSVAHPDSQREYCVS